MAPIRCMLAVTVALGFSVAPPQRAAADVTRMCYQKYVGNGAYVSVCANFANVACSAAQSSFNPFGGDVFSSCEVVEPEPVPTLDGARLIGQYAEYSVYFDSQSSLWAVRTSGDGRVFDIAALPQPVIESQVLGVYCGVMPPGAVLEGLPFVGFGPFNPPVESTGDFSVYFVRFVRSPAIVVGADAIEVNTQDLFFTTVAVCAADVGSQGAVPVPDGTVDSNDFIVYIDRFFNQDPAADIGTQGGVEGADSTWDNNDFVVFIDRFFADC